jgi:hypothetical protein
MKPALLFAVLFVLFSCTDHVILTETSAIDAACARCGKSQEEMLWLSAKIGQAKNDPMMNGNFYAVSTSEGVVIVHQPVIMSCMGCGRFDCNGDASTVSPQVVVNELVPGMNSSNLIYAMQ